MIIGITGSIGSGKTTIAKIFSKYHYNRIDADEIGHDLMKKNKILRNKILKDFGQEVLYKKKIIDRKKLGDIAFSDEKKFLKLNSIMHPPIISEIRTRIGHIKKECGDNAKIIVDAPLLLETNLKRYVDKVIVVKTFLGTIFKRNKRFHYDKLEKISKFQMPLYEKLKHADFVIDNNDDLNYLEGQVIRIIKKLNNKV